MKHIAFLALIVTLGIGATGCQKAEESGTGQPGNGRSGPSATGKSGEKTKIGFIVKSMADSWFQNETTFAKEKAAELGVDLTVQEAKNGTDVLTALDTMATNGCQGVIICSPEVQLGASIKAAATRNNLKLMSVDDRLVGGDGRPLADVPHLGISAANIGKQVGEAVQAEIKKRGWKPEEVAAMTVLVPALETAKLRVEGASQALVKSGFKKENIFNANWTGALDIAAASDAANGVLTAQGNFKKWVVYSSNDDGVIGGIRALANRGIPTENVIGVGINGSLAAAEWAKGQPTGLIGSILLQPKTHGGQTVEAMFNWITKGTEPQKEIYTEGTFINKDNYIEELKKQGMTIPKS